MPAIIDGMKTVGIIVEYNPLHNGHAWQIEQVKAAYGRDCAVIVAMSGHFTQRGEPALLDKWTRTNMALACGASLILELPAIYATASAERFARGGVQMLAATGVTKTLVFGSEHGHLPALERLAEALAFESDSFKAALTEELDSGQSFAAARQAALARILDNPEEANLLESSNNILAVEYLKANRQLPARRRLQPVTFQRQGQAFTDETITSTLASATAIRQAVRDARPSAAALLNRLKSTMPAASLAFLLEATQSGKGPLLPEDFNLAIQSLIRSRSAEDLMPFAGMGEGLAQRLVATTRTAEGGTWAGLLEAASSRRLPRTRVQRALCALLLNIRTTDYAACDAAGGPLYLRVLGFDKNGRYLLKLMREKATLPIITRGSDFHEYGDHPMLQQQAQFDLAATDLWQVAAGGKPGADFDRAVVIR